MNLPRVEGVKEELEQRIDLVTLLGAVADDCSVEIGKQWNLRAD